MVTKSERLRNILLNEKDYVIKQMEKIMAEMDLLPNGTLNIKSKSNKEYFYLVQLINGKTKAHYLGTSDTVNVNELREQLNKRKRLKAELKDCRIELNDINKFLK